MPTEQLLLEQLNTKKTQCDRLLEHFQKGCTITSMEAYHMGITQLATRLTELEAKGHSFNKPWKVLPSGVRVKEYSLVGGGIMPDACDECGKEDELFSFYEFKLCFECRRIAIENEAINARESELEERRLNI